MGDGEEEGVGGWENWDLYVKLKMAVSLNKIIKYGS